MHTSLECFLVYQHHTQSPKEAFIGLKASQVPSPPFHCEPACLPAWCWPLRPVSFGCPFAMCCCTWHRAWRMTRMQVQGHGPLARQQPGKRGRARETNLSEVTYLEGELALPPARTTVLPSASLGKNQEGGSQGLAVLWSLPIGV